MWYATVLTNGRAPHVHQALEQVGLSSAFFAIVDTSGLAVVHGKEIKVDGLGPRYDKGSYVKHVLMPKYMSQGGGHVVYVDDSVEFRSMPAHLGTCDVVELKREGSGVDEALLQTVNHLRDVALAKGSASVCMVYDFDCTISERHMWKAMHQPNSHWARNWANFKDAAYAA